MRFSNDFGYYELETFPGNASVCISKDVFIYPAFRGKGHGAQQHRDRLEQARKLGYTFIIATVNVNNARERHILEKNHWKYLDGFMSNASGDCCELWGRPL